MADQPDWSRALTMSERDFLFPPDEVPEDFDPVRAEKRFEAWRGDTGLQNDALFALSLKQKGLVAERFRHLLGSPPPDPGEGSAAPSWLHLAGLARGGPNGDGQTRSMPVAIAGGDAGEAVFVECVRPFLDSAWGLLQDALDGLDKDDSSFFDDPEVRRLFATAWARQLPSQLLGLGIRTWIFELYIRRLEGRLEGKTPEARFESFLADLCSTDGANVFWNQYPVLARSMAVRVEQWLSVGLELARHLDEDFKDLAETFGVAGAVHEIQAGLGDRHDGGRTVAILTFSNGERAVYKPRSLALDITFQGLLGWLGDQGIEPRLRPLEVLDRGGHGWVEHIAPTDCQSEAELRRFYARQGIYLALLFALEATDFHHENIIAAGEHPVLIDLETLFQPILLDSSTSREDLNPVATTILRSGLLPRFSWGEQGTDGVDVSGLGGESELSVPARLLAAVGTDEMTYIDGSQTVKRGDHRPRLHGEIPPLWRHSQTVLDSFTATYRRLVELRPRFLEPGGWIDRFAGLGTRVIPRPTGLYVRLLHVGYHPDHLQDARSRDQLFDKLWFDAARFPYIPPLIPYERHDLWQGDVPRFGSQTDSSDLISSSGATIEGVLVSSGLSLVRHRFEQLGEEDLARQLSLATLAFAALRPQTSEMAPPISAVDLPSAGSELALHPASPESFLEAARRVGERLEVVAIRSEGWASWFHLRPAGSGPQLLEPVDASLYAGLGGMAIFLAQLGRATGEDRFTNLAREAFAVGRDRFVRQAQVRQSLGGFAGLGGWIYTLTHLGALWGEPALFREAEEIAARYVGSLLPRDQGLDVIAGAAGATVALLELHHHQASPEILRLAVACGESLLAKAAAQEHGVAWPIPSLGPRPLTGFAHGTAGLAWALALLAVESGEDRFHDIANGALTYERHLFSPVHRNWPDLREERRQDGAWGYFHAWCHGAPGIGLSRLDLLERWPGDRLDRAGREAEIRAAASSTLELGFGDNHSLCHGDLGNLELIHGAAELLDDADLRRAGERLDRWLLSGLDDGAYRCGIKSSAEVPGLMTGLAGIGYGLLRRAAPAEIPSILLLKTPTPANGLENS